MLMKVLGGDLLILGFASIGILGPMAVIVVELFPMSIEGGFDAKRFVAVFTSIQTLVQKFGLDVALLFEKIAIEMLSMENLEVLNHAFAVTELFLTDWTEVFGLLFGIDQYVL